MVMELRWIMKNLIKINEKEINIVNKINEFKNPLHIYIPILKQRTFKLNDYIFKNTYFDDLISSISGNITGIKKIFYKNKRVEALEITNDFKENVSKKRKKVKIKNKEELILLLNDYHLNEIVDKIEYLDNLNNLVVSSIDDEIYSVKEFLRLANNHTEILETTDNLLNILNINYGIIATKNTNFKSIKNVKSIIGTYPNLKITLVPDKYLIGKKEFLCDFLNLKKENTLVLTTSDIYKIYNVIKKAKDINENLITVSGDAIEKSLIINVRLYTSLEEIINEYINIISNEYEVYLNGYLSGKKISDIKEIVITKDIHSIVINKKSLEEETDCINCGACMRICPLNINVKKCYFNKLSHKKCIGCGLCNFICPSNIDLKKIVKSDSK